MSALSRCRSASVRGGPPCSSCSSSFCFNRFFSAWRHQPQTSSRPLGSDGGERPFRVYGADTIELRASCFQRQNRVHASVNAHNDDAPFLFRRIRKWLEAARPRPENLAPGKTQRTRLRLARRPGRLIVACGGGPQGLASRLRFKERGTLPEYDKEVASADSRRVSAGTRGAYLRRYWWSLLGPLHFCRPAFYASRTPSFWPAQNRRQT